MEDIIKPDRKKPMLSSKAHCQIAQKAHHQNQKLSIGLPALPHKDKKNPVANSKS